MLAIVAVLWATTDDRHAGVIADGRQMAWTAIALTESGTIGQTRYRDLTVPRPQGDAVSRYGIAMSLAQVPAALLAPVVERSLGPGSSQPLFIVSSFLFVMLTAVFAAAAARALGASARGERIALVLATIGSPLAAYAALDLSEPLQAACLAAAYLAALRRHGALAGLAVGLAVLTKSSLLVVAPLACLPLLAAPRDERRRIILHALATFGACLFTWLVLEVDRFGRPFASYGGEGFTHPFVDGLWRLLVGVNKGILWYFPAIVAVAFALRSRRIWHERGLAVAGAILPFAALLALAAPWWAWDGAFGWGPRLIVPAIPLLAACAAVEIETWTLAPRAILLGASVLVNVPPLLAHPAAIAQEELAETWPEVSPDVAARVPPFARRRDGETWRVVPHVVRSTVASASPLVEVPRSFVRQPAWHAWGRGFLPSDADRPYGRVYDRGLADQVMRAQHMRDLLTADRLARKLSALAPDGFSDALLMETYRLQHRDQDAVNYLTSLPVERRQHPAINVVLALWERDRGNEQGARAFLESVAHAFPDSPVQRAVKAPLPQWPADFATITEDDALRVGSSN